MSEGDATAPLTGRPTVRGDTRSMFAADDLVADRYRVIRFIAQGGMGEVYEVRDIELREIVAMKTIRPEVAASAAVVDRFKREIQLARQITHPNVSRVFDLGKHTRADGSEVTFLTMELIRGEPLTARIKQGAMPIAEALPLLRQIAAGIDAAHAKGIVHRDLKPGNVLVDAAVSRAIVTDFGIAHVSGEGGDGLLTGTGEVMGSPAYMSPEQVEGAALTTASDLYSFGIVAYELVTGARPFDESTPLTTAAKRLRQDPKPPRAHVATLPETWNSAILRLLAREPADRFATASAFIAALGGEDRRRPRWLVPMLVVAALGIAGGVFAVARRGGTTAQTTETRTPIAILGFKNSTGKPDAAWLSTAIAEMLATELAAGERIRILPGELVVRAKSELAITDELSHSAETLARIRTRLGSDYVVTGSYVVTGDNRLRLDVRLEDATAGTVLLSIAETGSEAKLFELVTSVGAQLRDRLGAPVLTPSEEGTVRASLPADPEAARLYADGLARARGGDAQGARSSLERARDLEPQHPLIHAALSLAWTQLGYDGRAADEAGLAHERRSSLAPYEQQLIEARYRETRHEWDAAIAIYSSLLRAQPDNLERGLRLVAAQIDASRGTEALAAIEQLRRLPPPAPTEPSLDLYESRAAALIGDEARTLAAAERGIAHAEARGARKLAIEGWIYKANGEWGLGRYPAAIESAQHALTMLDGLKDDLQRARALATLASIRGDLGEKPAASVLYREALELMRKLDNKNGIAIVLNNLAIDMIDQGDLAGAWSQMEESLAIAREIGDRSQQGVTEVNLAEIARQRGDLPEAGRRLEGALADAQQRGDRDRIAEALHVRAALDFDAGELAKAREGYEAALVIEKELELEGEHALTAIGLAQLAAASDDSAGALARFDEAIAIQQKLGRRWDRWVSIIWRSLHLLEVGRAADALAALDTVLGEVDPDAKEIARFARAARAWALAANNRGAEVEREVANAVPPPIHASRRYPALLAMGRALAASGSGGRDAAVQFFYAARTEAEQHGYRGAALAARLEHAALYRDRAKLDAIAAEAKTAGFTSLARRATSIAHPDRK